MGCFDYVEVDREEFKCSEGHVLEGAEFQTKDLGCTMGHWIIGETLTGEDGGWGEDTPRPFTGTVDIYASCEECPAFIQAKTFNLCDHWVEFRVEIVEDIVRKVTRTSPPTSEWIETEPKEKWMAGCLGPMPHAEAEEIHSSRIWPNTPVTPPSDNAP